MNKKQSLDPSLSPTHFAPPFIERKAVKAVEDFFFHAFIASSKHSGGWKNSRKLCKPKTASRVCITVSNSPNSPGVYRCKHGKSTLMLKYKSSFGYETGLNYNKYTRYRYASYFKQAGVLVWSDCVL